MPIRTIILAGAGHAHLYVASRTRELVAAGARVLLIDPGKFWYSGLATGMLGGSYEAEDDQIDPQALIEACGGEFITGRVESVDCGQRRVTLADGQSMHYDFLSINTGSRVSMNTIPGLANGNSVFPVKPVSNLWRLREHLEAEFRVGRQPHTVVIGGGPTGVEVAANIAGLCERIGVEAPITLATRSARLVTQMRVGVSRALARNLNRRGVKIWPNTDISEYRDNTLITVEGENIAADIVVPAIGLQASTLIQNTGLPADKQEGLRINNALHSVADERVFSGGDCASMESYNLPKLGVFGVRQASVIHSNLLARLNAQPLQEYQPQKRYLAVLNLGDGTGLASWGPFWWRGAISMKVKDFIDRRFMDGYRKRYQNIKNG